MLGFYLFKPSIHSKDDLECVKGKYSRHSFTYSSLRGGGYRYYVWLKNYSNPFKIKADFIDHSLKRKFEGSIRFGDELIIDIQKGKKPKLNSNENIFIYSMRSNEVVYIDSKDTLAKHNSPFLLFISIGFILFGVLYFVARKRYVNP